ncbi:hypothetical protein [Paraburkholderia sp. BL10I2N1]|uniref:DUF7338 family protein n=1 Tax=Paraburkholderia sp. BL10I2N1 TaxID=1938796 RepID=UPI00105C1A6F|nr:hypothetical protein [Paraburkholderia sp. BL10I2N1]TDN70399.1 hypothetical protein B0G77_3872 [Paraburkholderia sp. BL10I2N1]
MLLLYPFFALGSVLMGGLTWLLAPLLAMTTGADGNLPTYLYWFQTFDATLDDCRKPPFSWTGSLESTRTQWLRRNPGYGFDYWPFGIAFDAAHWTVVTNSASWFFAWSRYGAFCLKYQGTGVLSLKLGWKAWAYWQNDAWAAPAYSWGPSHRAPVCLSFKFW